MPILSVSFGVKINRPQQCTDPQKLAILPTIVSTATFAIATRNIGATKASVLGVFEPIAAILVATLMFGEPLTPNIVIGIVVAVIAVTFMISITKRYSVFVPNISHDVTNWLQI